MATNWINVSKLLLPQNTSFHHALDEVSILAGDNGPASFVSDYSGNGRTLLGSGSIPLIKKSAIKANLFDYRPAVYFSGTNDPLRFTGASTLLKHIFLLVKIDATTFTGNEGLYSDTGSNNILAGGGAATTKFINLSLGYSYWKNGVNYLEPNLQAPMNEYGLLEIQTSSGLSMVGLQIGRQLNGAAAKFKGWFFEHVAYNRVLTETERQRVLMYFHLKFGTQKYGANQLYFPSDNFLDFKRFRFKAENPDYDKITDSFEFEDGGKSFNETADSAVRRWEYEYQGRTPDQLAIFDEFYNQARKINKFRFVDKYGETHDNVQIESYSGDHEGHKSWRNSAKFVLVKFP